MKSKNLVIALFDSQLDYISSDSTDREMNKWHPTTAIFSLRNLPIATQFILLTPKEHENVATRLKPVIERHLKQAIHFRIKNSDVAKGFSEDIAVQIIPIEYKNIWDITACKESLEPELRKIKKDCEKQNSSITVTISLLGGTTAAKTALYLLSKRHEHDKKFQLRYVKSLTPGRASNKDLRLVTDISLTQNGFLCQGVGTSHPGYSAALDKLERVIQNFRHTSILITGQTGAGKSELARLIIAYMQSLHDNITDKNCIVQNVAAIAESLLESEFFGHEKGAFTDAVEMRRGIFERGKSGIIFLDEIGELPKHLQAKVLTVLDGTPFTRVGGEGKICSKFLLICGTNKDLRKECEAGRFRLDLYERLKTWHIDIPSLKDRPNDIERALQREIGEWETAHNRKIDFKAGARKDFLDKAKLFPWEGNFREFHATFLHLALSTGDGYITKDAIKDEFEYKYKEIGEQTSSSYTQETTSDETCNSVYDYAEMARLACALDVCRKCKTATEAGEKLFAARLASARQKGTGFNGAASLQRVFAPFGLEAHFKNGTFSISSLTRQSSDNETFSRSLT